MGAKRESAIASDYKQLAIDLAKPGLWTISFKNPPINLLEPATIVELQALVSEIEMDPSLKVVMFEAADPDFFIAHFDASKAAELSQSPGPTGYAPWLDFVLRLNSAPPRDADVRRLRPDRQRLTAQYHHRPPEPGG